MKKTVLYELKKRFWVRERDLGANRVLKKNGMTFTLSAYEIGNLGAMSVIEMSAMFGLMQMESFILTASEKDLPYTTAILSRLPANVRCLRNSTTQCSRRWTKNP